MNFNYYIPTRILFGRGKLNELHKQQLPGKKALIVISAGKSTRANGYLGRVEKELEKAGVSSIVYDKILANPIKKHVMEGAAVAKAEGCDFVIGLGGGSSMDAAKAIAVMATNEGDYWDYIHGGSGKGQPIPNDPLPLIAITTTAGTGTEADPWMVITKEETGEKIGSGYDKTFPFLSIVDPELMLTVPPLFTAYQGFDALFHSTEGYLNRTAYTLSDMYALKAISLIAESLPVAVKEGNNIDAREKVALANTLSGMVESTSGCISAHSLEHALSGFAPSLPHGAGLVMISIPYYTHMAGSEVCRERMIDMAKAMGKKDATSPSDFVDALLELEEACGVTGLKLSDYGIKESDIPALEKHARDTMGGLFTVDPIVLSEEDTLSILKQSYK